MKPKTLKIILAAVKVVSIALAIYCLVVSMKDTGSSWALPAALGLTALGNFINIYSLKKFRYEKSDLDAVKAKLPSQIHRLKYRKNTD